MMDITDKSVSNQVLNSWKEIACYLDRGVRTVQRWESELGLPVRRPQGKGRSAVIAIRSELDEWLRIGPLAAEHEIEVKSFKVNLRPRNLNSGNRGAESEFLVFLYLPSHAEQERTLLRPGRGVTHPRI